jgi:hypothetical protein
MTVQEEVAKDVFVGARTTEILRFLRMTLQNGSLRMTVVRLAKRLWWTQPRFVERLDGLAPFGGEVAPRSGVLEDERDLLHAQPALQLFFPRDCIADVLEALEVDEAVDLVTGGEGGWIGGGFVGGDACSEVVGYSDVEATGSAGEDVDVVLVVTHGLKRRISAGSNY